MKMRAGAAFLLLLALLAGCDESEETAAVQDVPKVRPDLLEFAPSPPPPPPPEPEPVVLPPAPVVREVAPPPPPPPPPEPAPEVVLVPPPFEPPREAEFAAELQALRRARAASAAQIVREAAAPPGPSEPPEAEWLLKDEDYSRDDLDEDISTLPVDRFRVITADRYITAVLENSVNSQIPGRFIALVERHVYGADGRIPLLPKGTRIICTYEELARQGDTRLPGACTRAIRPDGASILLTGAEAADQVARTGLVGEVDNRTWERYGTAITVSVISALAAAGGGLADNPLAEAGSVSLSQNLGQVTAKVLEQAVDLAPIVTVAAGSRIQIIPSTDIWIRKPEPANQTARNEGSQ